MKRLPRKGVKQPREIDPRKGLKATRTPLAPVTNKRKPRKSIHQYLEEKTVQSTKRKSKSRREAEKRFDQWESDSVREAWAHGKEQGVDRLETRIQLIASEPRATLKWVGDKDKRPAKKPLATSKRLAKGWKVVMQAGQRVAAPKGWTVDQPDPPGTRRIAIVQSRSGGSGMFGARSPIRISPKLKVMVHHQGDRTWKKLDQYDARRKAQVGLFDDTGKLVSMISKEFKTYRGEDGELALKRFRSAEKVALLPKKVAAFKMSGATVEDALKRVRIPLLKYGQMIEIEYRVHFWTNDEQGTRHDHTIAGSIYEDWRRSFIDPKKAHRNDLTSREKSVEYWEVIQRRLAMSIRSTLMHGNHPARFTTMKKLQGGLAAYEAWTNREGLAPSKVLSMTIGDKEGVPRNRQTKKQRRPLFNHLRATGVVPAVLITEAEFDRLAAYEQARDCHIMVWTTVYDLED